MLRDVIERHGVSNVVRLRWAVAKDTDSERRRMVNPRKAYPIDSGLMTLYNRSEKANSGHALETMVLVELQRRHAEVHYVRKSTGPALENSRGHPRTTRLRVDASEKLNEVRPLVIH